MDEVRIEKIGQGQIYDLITGEELSWQNIIYDLIKTEQLDPWDIDVGALAEGYAKKLQEFEEADFFVSSKVLLACSLLLRLKSEILINTFIQDLDDALYGRKESQATLPLQRIELDENELPILTPKTPMARHRKVTLEELMTALHKAIETENRRIKKDINDRQADKSALVVLPQGEIIPLKTRIKNIFERLKQHIKSQGKQSMLFSELAQTRDEKIFSFVPVLHLSNDGTIYLHQKGHYEEIHMSFEMLKEEIELLASEVGLKEDEVEEIEEELDEEIEKGELLDDE